MAGTMSEMSTVELPTAAAAADQEIESLNGQIERQFKIQDELLATKYQEEIQQVQAFRPELKEYAKCAAKYQKIAEKIASRQEKIEALRDQNEAFLINIQKSREKIENLKQEIEVLQEQLNQKKKMKQELDSMFESLGLDVEKDENGNGYHVQLSKLPIRNYDMKFSFDIRQDTDDQIKILSMKPDNCIDADAVLKELESCTDKNKFLLLIVMIRRELIRKYS